MKRTAWGVVSLVVLIAVLFVAVFPSRTYLAQRHSLASTEDRLAVLSDQNEVLAARVQRLNTDGEIERLAREQYNLVRPGEEAYAILPSPAPPRQEKRQAPKKESDPGLLSKVWDSVTFWS